jgi:DNA-binding IclR family transcriptional regulator
MTFRTSERLSSRLRPESSGVAVASQGAAWPARGTPSRGRDGAVSGLEPTVSTTVSMTEAEQPKQLVATIERALSVLDLMASTDRDDLGVTEIARELDLSKAVVHRVLVTLVSRDYLQVDPSTRRYSLGPMALVLGSAYLAQLDLRTLALPRLQELSDRTGETATFSLRNGWNRMYVDQVTPDREIKMAVAIGKAYPLHAGSSSKSFLAFLPAEEQERYLQERELTALTTATIIDPDRLRTELAAIRQRGYAVSLEERQAGAASIAAPILDRHGLPIAAVSVCGPVERFRDQLETVPSLLLQTCGELSRLFGYRSEAPTPIR